MVENLHGTCSYLRTRLQWSTMYIPYYLLKKIPSSLQLGCWPLWTSGKSSRQGTSAILLMMTRNPDVHLWQPTEMLTQTRQQNFTSQPVQVAWMASTTNVMVLTIDVVFCWNFRIFIPYICCRFNYVICSFFSWIEIYI